MIKLKKLYQEYKEIINYLIFGFLTTIISLISYYLLTLTILDPKIDYMLQIANFISWVVGVLFAYFSNRKYVFNSETKNRVKEFITFTGSRITTLILDMLIMYIFVSVLKGNDKIFKLISQVLVIVLNYILSKFIVFKKGSNEKSTK